MNTDIAIFASSFPLKSDLAGSTFLVTGATGLIGSVLIRCLLRLGDDIRIIAPVRNLAKAQEMFADAGDRLEFMQCDLETADYSALGSVDFIVHCAAPTSSRFFVEHPVETFEVIVGGTSSLLKYAAAHPVKGFVYLSSLEVYGTTDRLDSIPEEVQGYWSVTDVRSSYPVAKRAAEHLCHLYAKEYGVPVKIARLTQTTGAGISKDDGRVIAQFARCAARHQDIVLHSTGESARPYCYTTDAVGAILYILLRGQSGEPYNVANPGTYISARALAEFVKENLAPDINVVTQIRDDMGYAPASFLPLDTSKLESLGWKSGYSLYDILKRLVEYLDED